ncbi:MAG TPA: tRNA preQ1(34) S-adenosylmethionine ribosyltransferase-isomerase QueA [Labilithrix sp.]|nr:tRNA preQ1(34) S-adenosylmethionine ribosyltransferase-isomerase QueA [Labilithrix sp.]
MRVEAFDYALPPELIAQAPTDDREQARLLVVPRDGAPRHRTIADLAEHVAPGTLVVVNDTKVVPARILGTKEGTGGRTEVFLVKRLPDAEGAAGLVERWSALARASKALRPGTRIVKDALVVDFEGKGEDGLFEVRLSTRDGSPVEQARRDAGQVPLPPYIRREVRAQDVERYQTVFARAEGAVAAPTAGLHLTSALVKRLESRGCEIGMCTLHVGLGTFQPVMVEDLDDHPMHAEYFEVGRPLAAAIARARERGAPVLAVGTTVVRALESARDPARPGHVRACAEETRILIQPGYSFGVVDRLLTNFHLPKSTLLALVAAFTPRVLDLYAEAVKERYRFFSYGDAMLLDREAP